MFMSFSCFRFLIPHFFCLPISWSDGKKGLMVGMSELFAFVSVLEADWLWLWEGFWLSTARRLNHRTT
jgi:hypothetical protein